MRNEHIKFNHLQSAASKFFQDVNLEVIIITGIIFEISLIFSIITVFTGVLLDLSISLNGFTNKNRKSVICYDAVIIPKPFERNYFH